MKERLKLELFFIHQWLRNIFFIIGCGFWIFNEWTNADLPYVFELEENILRYPDGGMPQSVSVSFGLKGTVEHVTCPTRISELIGYVCDTSLVEKVLTRVVIKSVKSDGRLIESVVTGSNVTTRTGASSIEEIICFGVQFVIDFVQILRPNQYRLVIMSATTMIYLFVCSDFISLPRDSVMLVFRFVVGCILLARLVWFMSTHPRLGFLARTISVGLGDIVHFVFILFSIYCLISFMGTIFLGDCVETGLWVQFQYLLAQWDFVALYARVGNKVLLFAYLLLFQLVFLLLIMNVFLAVLLASYETGRGSAHQGSLIQDGFWTIVETWKGWREKWPSRKSVIDNNNTHDEGFRRMEEFYTQTFGISDSSIIEERLRHLEALIEARLQKAPQKDIQIKAVKQRKKRSIKVPSLIRESAKLDFEK